MPMCSLTEIHSMTDRPILMSAPNVPICIECEWCDVDEGYPAVSTCQCPNMVDPVSGVKKRKWSLTQR